MKSMLFSALVIFALATTGCALQTGGGGGGCSDGLCGNQGVAGDCGSLSGDCGCGAPKGLTPPSCNLMRNLSDKRGMGLRVNQRGSACNQGRNNGLFSRMGGGSSVAPAASMDCGCGCGGGGSSIVSMSDGGCGCGAEQQGGGLFSKLGAGGAAAGAGIVGGGVVGGAGCGCGTQEAGGLLGKLGGGCKLGGCKLGKCLLGGKAAAAGAGIVGGGIGGGMLGGGCGLKGCGLGGSLCSGCLSKYAEGHHHPYGGTIPHTAQVPGNGTGMAPAYAYPYYTTRSPRDFLMKNPPTIGY